MLAAAEGNVAVVAHLLDNGADATQTEGDATALTFAARGEHDDKARAATQETEDEAFGEDQNLPGENPARVDRLANHYPAIIGRLLEQPGVAPHSEHVEHAVSTLSVEALKALLGHPEKKPDLTAQDDNGLLLLHRVLTAEKHYRFDRQEKIVKTLVLYYLNQGASIEDLAAGDKSLWLYAWTQASDTGLKGLLAAAEESEGLKAALAQNLAYENPITLRRRKAVHELEQTERLRHTGPYYKETNLPKIPSMPTIRLALIRGQAFFDKVLAILPAQRKATFGGKTLFQKVLDVKNPSSINACLKDMVDQKATLSLTSDALKAALGGQGLLMFMMRNANDDELSAFFEIMKSSPALWQASVAAHADDRVSGDAAKYSYKKPQDTLPAATYHPTYVVRKLPTLDKLYAPIHIAACRGQQFVKALLALDPAQRYAKTKNGQTALTLAANINKESYMVNALMAGVAVQPAGESTALDPLQTALNVQSRKAILQGLTGYIAWWKFSWFGHHHDARARAVKSAINKSTTLGEALSVLYEQQMTFSKVGRAKKWWSQKAAERDNFEVLYENTGFNPKDAERFIGSLCNKPDAAHKGGYITAIESGIDAVARLAKT